MNIHHSDLEDSEVSEADIVYYVHLQCLLLVLVRRHWAGGLWGWDSVYSIHVRPFFTFICSIGADTRTQVKMA